MQMLMETGKYYLFACPWDWTFVGRFRCIQGGRVYIDHTIYFIRTGAKFGPLCHKGLVAESQYVECGDGIGIGNLDDIKTFPWRAATPWGSPTADAKGR